jgi:hypothetical protein
MSGYCQSPRGRARAVTDSKEEIMSLKTIVLSGIACALGVVSFSPPAASAYCGLLSYSGFGLSENDALQAANNKGLVKVRQLDAKYVKRVIYEKATWKCAGADHVACTITQRYCIDGK